MGMFDYISFDESIELPDFPKELDRNKLQFQTKDLKCCMMNFVVNSEKLLHFHKEEGEWFDNPNIKFLGKEFKVDREWWDFYDFTGEVHFYDSVKHPEKFSEEYEPFRYRCGWIEYVAHFWKGELKQINLHRYDEPTKLSDKELEELRELQKQNREKLDRQIRENRKNNPSIEQKLIDDIDNIVNFDNIMMSSEDFNDKLRKINDKITEYRTKHDTYYEKG